MPVIPNEVVWNEELTTLVTFACLESLPPGLTLNALTGRIRGSPTSPSDEMVYTVRATNANGYSDAKVAITIQYASPKDLAYSAPDTVFIVGQKYTNLPQSRGGIITQYSIAPPLPAGLTFNTEWGVVLGTPTELAQRRDYEITGRNNGGRSIVKVTLACFHCTHSVSAWSKHSNWQHGRLVA
jgi:hypothetical protein